MNVAPEEQIDWIDEQGDVIETVPRSAMRRRNLLHRTTATLVFHPDGRLFVHQRTPSKDAYPGLFDMVVGGTVVSGETCAENACRELSEELGVRGVPVYELFEHRFRDEVVNNLIRVYACVYDGPITLQPQEVAAGCWSAAARVEELIAAGRMCPDSTAGWALFRLRYPQEQWPPDLAGLGLAAIDCARWVGAP